MFGGENVALIFGRELFAVIERQLQRCVVRMQDYIGSDNFTLQLRMLSLVARILMITHVPPGPSVEASIPHASNVVGNEVVTQPVALIDRTP